MSSWPTKAFVMVFFKSDQSEVPTEQNATDGNDGLSPVENLTSCRKVDCLTFAPTGGEIAEATDPNYLFTKNLKSNKKYTYFT